MDLTSDSLIDWLIDWFDGCVIMAFLVGGATDLSLFPLSVTLGHLLNCSPNFQTWKWSELKIFMSTKTLLLFHFARRAKNRIHLKQWALNWLIHWIGLKFFSCRWRHCSLFYFSIHFIRSKVQKFATRWKMVKNPPAATLFPQIHIDFDFKRYFLIWGNFSMYSTVKNPKW